MERSPPSKLYTCLQTILPILLRCTYFRIFRHRLCFHASALAKACSQLSTHSIQLKMAIPALLGVRHYDLAQEIRRTLAQYAQLKDIIAMLGLEQLSRKTAMWSPARAAWSDFLLNRFSLPAIYRT